MIPEREITLKSVCVHVYMGCVLGVGWGQRLWYRNEISQNQGVSVWWWRHSGNECGLVFEELWH